MVMQAQDTFTATLGNGSERLVAKGEVLADAHELVRRDAAAQREAEEAGVSRTPLFRPLDLGEEEDAAAREKSRAQAAKGTTSEGPAAGDAGSGSGTQRPASSPAPKGRSGTRAGSSGKS